jgi:hypothetical protein
VDAGVEYYRSLVDGDLVVGPYNSSSEDTTMHNQYYFKGDRYKYYFKQRMLRDVVEQKVRTDQQVHEQFALMDRNDDFLDSLNPPEFGYPSFLHYASYRTEVVNVEPIGNGRFTCDCTDGMKGKKCIHVICVRLLLGLILVSKKTMGTPLRGVHRKIRAHAGRPAKEDRVYFLQPPPKRGKRVPRAEQK